MTPNRLAAAKPSLISLAMPTAVSTVRCLDLRMKLFRSSPETYSMVMKWAPSTSPMSYIPQTFGCRTLRASFSSFENRSIVSGSEAISGLMSLRAIFSWILASKTL